MMLIKKIEVCGRMFTIVKHMNHYCAVEDKYIGADGRLTKAMNGIELGASHSLDACEEHLRNRISMENLMADGLSWAEAFSKVTGLPLEVCEKLNA